MPKIALKIWMVFGANETYHTIWSKNPFSFPPLEKNEPSKQRAKCVRLSGTIIATVLSSLPYVPFLLAFQQLLSYQNFAASRKGWWESAKTRWWNQPWCFDGSCLLEGLWPTAFTLSELHHHLTTVEVTRLSKSSAQNSAHTTLFEHIFKVSLLNFCAKNTFCLIIKNVIYL